MRRANIIDFEPSTEDIIYKVMVRVYNREGYDDSPYLRIMNSGHPAAITTSVQLLHRNSTSVQVEMPLVTDDDKVFSYSLEMDDGLGGQY
jgi:hypothetical protein